MILFCIHFSRNVIILCSCSPESIEVNLILIYFTCPLRKQAACKHVSNQGSEGTDGFKSFPRDCEISPLRRTS